MKDTSQFKKVCTQTLDANWLQQKNVQLDVLRLDNIHSIISGNKWFKLKYYLQDAQNKDYNTVATFGGAYSNHIIATAYACKSAELKSIGIIRGEQPPQLSRTLLQAQQYDMELHFVSRIPYKDIEVIKNQFKNAYWINEGGYGSIGARGAKEILSLCQEPGKYSHIVCAVGTGTMMAGIIGSANAGQCVIGISVMKGNKVLLDKVQALIGIKNMNKSYQLLHDYHFGGYAKHPAELLQFMNETWLLYQLPTDIVYTAKTFYAVRQMVMNNTIPANSNVLMIHSGGLQGNLSLPAKTLLF